MIDTKVAKKRNGKGFQVGEGKPEGSGRQKGTPNKKTAELIDRIENSGMDIVEALLDLYRTTDKEEIKLSILRELMSYVFPKRKAIDLSETIVSEKIFITQEDQKAVEEHIDSVIGKRG